MLYSAMSYKIGYQVFNYIENREDIFVYGMNKVYIITAAICLCGAILTFKRLSKYNKNLVK